MEPSKAFGKVLRERRSARGLSQERLALEAGLERVYISLLERGQRQPTLTTLLKLAGPLECGASDLVREAEILCREEQGNGPPSPSAKIPANSLKNR